MILKSIYIVLLITYPCFLMALDTGDGSDGACNFNATTINNGVHNCTTLTVTGTVTVNLSQGATVPLTIKVQGDVDISGTLTVNGAVGEAGNDVALTDSTGGVGGPAGFDGGGCTDGAAGSAGQGGGYNGEGQGGGLGTESGTTAQGGTGGGGGGGRYGTATLPTAGAIGVDGGGVGDSSGAAGAAGTSSYAPESSFETLFLGGSGGGSGGSGAGDFSGTFSTGAGGGGGGGAVRIISGGDVDISGSVTANGGNGGNATTFGGGGAGGAGGGIWIQAVGDITLVGTISAQGGSGGSGATTPGTGAGDGGDGGSGRIRLDDRDGAVTGGGTITPAATYVSTLDATEKQHFTSDISCATIDINNDDNFSGPASFLAGAFLILIFFRRSTYFE